MTNRNDYNRQVIEEFRANGGKVSGPFEHTPLLLLTTTGFEDYPRLTEEDVKACLDYAEAVIEGEEVFSTPQKQHSPTL